MPERENTQNIETKIVAGVLSVRFDSGHWVVRRRLGLITKDDSEVKRREIPRGM